MFCCIISNSIIIIKLRQTKQKATRKFVSYTASQTGSQSMHPQIN